MQLNTTNRTLNIDIIGVGITAVVKIIHWIVWLEINDDEF